MVTSIDGVGSKNSIVARIFIQTHEALKNALLKKELNKEEIIVLSHSCKEFLLSCEKAFLEFNEKYGECKRKFEEGKVKRERNILSEFPTIDNLDQIAAVFLSNAKKIIETEAKIVNGFFNTSFNGPRFDVIIKWAEENIPDKTEFITFLKSTNDELWYITDLRNHQEHPQKDRKTHINNFRILPDNQIGLPSWYVTGNEEADMRSDMSHAIEFLMQFFEVLMFHCILINLDTKFPFKVTEVPEGQRDKNCPIRYKLEIDPEMIFGKK